MNKHQDDLIARYIADKTNPAEFQQALQHDPQFKKRAARHFLIHKLLKIKLNQTDTEAFTSSVMARINQQDKAVAENKPQFKSVAARQVTKHFWYNGLPIAASILVCILLFFAFDQSNTELATVHYGPSARMTKTADKELFTLAAGPFQLLEGKAEITFKNGVILKANAPVHLHIKDKNDIKLVQGQLEVKLPAKSDDFIVRTQNDEYIITSLAANITASDADKYLDLTPIYRQIDLPYSFKITAHSTQLLPIAEDQTQQSSGVGLPFSANNATNKTENKAENNTTDKKSEKDAEQTSNTEQDHSHQLQILKGLNSGFETGDLTDWLIDAKSLGFASVKAEAAKSGNYGLHINTMNAGPVFLLIDHKSLPAGFVKKHKQYKISFDIKRVSKNAESADGFTRFTNSYNSDFQATAHGPWFRMPRDNQWQHYEKIIDGADWPTTHTFVEIAFWTPNEEWYLDNVKLVELKPAKNLIQPAVSGFESGKLSAGFNIERQIDRENFAILQVTKDAAIDGNYGLYANTTTGEMQIKFTSNAFTQPRLEKNTDYLFAYDLKVIQGKVSLNHIPNTGNSHFKPKWRNFGFERGKYWVDGEGLVRVRVIIPAHEIPENQAFELNIQMNAGAIAHFDNFELSKISSE
ncbi:hypothetical protein [Catenovulum sediminis]|uniref:hypothetical protein n=1 Tax=Catenovulum sediminis TaxID=1740262 RepID=UPI00117FF92C|nr:hypothetical protein [Catenovulum sediminis]